jgi:hypothetical protein
LKGLSAALLLLHLLLLLRNADTCCRPKIQGSNSKDSLLLGSQAGLQEAGCIRASYPGDGSPFSSASGHVEVVTSASTLSGSVQAGQPVLKAASSELQQRRASNAVTER